ncbi:50S ribosomal protein L24 [Candidatus Peregrinibacteria bacterium]|nr:50S ribosomal protein L24 [Candidatus Peregrinibacteria bacterium]
MKIKISDNVLVIAGKYRGKTGKVIRVIKTSGKVVIEKINLVTKHVKKSKANKGERIRFEAPLDASNVMIVCPQCSKPTRIGYLIDKKVKTRICRICKESVDQKVDSAAIKTKKSKKS